MTNNYSLSNLWQYDAARIVTFFLIAWLIYLLARFFARRIMFFIHLPSRSSGVHPERIHTLESLVSSAIRLAAFTAAIIATISLFVDASTVVWVIGLLSAGFSLAARPLISDIMTGISFMFEDTFAVGEKVQIIQAAGPIEGVIESINLRTTWIRSPTGDLYTIPNGEIRILRNFSRGHFSLASITLNIPSENLDQALPLLETLGRETNQEFSDLLEPWQIISKKGKLGQQTELSLIVKTSFGNAGDLRPRLLALVHERLSKNGINLEN
jgi:small-conductance mechanosensitive channel